MARYFLFVLGFIIFTSTFNAQEVVEELSPTSANDSLISDGPYVFIEGEKLIEKSIVDGELISKDLGSSAYPTQFKAKKSQFKNVSKVAALSDIHGQYEVAIEILKNNEIVDENLKWNFGNGHLVIVGDIFDRGPKVNEVLWLIYNLEKEAASAGGAVHYLLGNHEYLVLEGDMRYINPKYRTTMRLLKMNYSALYGPNTVLGRWLRSKPTIAKINGITYVHGGISKELLEDGFKMDKINTSMLKSIDTPDSLKVKDPNRKYFKDSGPIWYRGYFYDNLPDEEIAEILTKTKSKHIIVGHCSHEEIVKLYDGKIYGVDSSIKNGESGEVLFIQGNDFSRGTMSGERKSFNTVEEPNPEE